jgi:hypothetical protein
MFRERPITTGALGEMAKVGQQWNEERQLQPELPLWMQGAARLERDGTGRQARQPIAPLAGLAEPAWPAGVRKQVSCPIDYLNPGLQRSSWRRALPVRPGPVREGDPAPDAPMMLQRQLLG